MGDVVLEDEWKDRGSKARAEIKEEYFLVHSPFLI